MTPTVPPPPVTDNMIPMCLPCYAGDTIKHNVKKRLIKMWTMISQGSKVSTEGVKSQLRLYKCLFVCVEVLRPSQPNGVMSSTVSLPNHTFTGQAKSSKRLTSIVHILSPETDKCPSWISGRERMTLENISWSISTKECCRPPIQTCRLIWNFAGCTCLKVHLLTW